MNSHIDENRRERERLRALVARISEPDLSRELREGWTVAAALAHLAFWDLRQLALLKVWKRDGVASAPVEVESVNEAVRILSGSIPPKSVAQLAVDAAESVDREIEKIGPALAAAIDAAGHERALRRHLHRGEHLSKIEEFLDP